MKQKLLLTSRQKRLAAYNRSPKRVAKNLLLIAAVLALAILFVLALLFLQANQAASELKKANDHSLGALKDTVQSATHKIATMNVQEQKDAAEIVKSINEVSLKANEVSEICVQAPKPYITAFAKKYPELSTRCQSITTAARELRDALVAFMPFIQYQGELTAAVSPVVMYHRSDDKVDIDKGIIAWTATKNNLQKANAPEPLRDVNAALIDKSTEIINQLERAKEAKYSNRHSDYSAATASLVQLYKQVNSQADPIQKQLISRQLALNNALKQLP